MHVTTRGPIDGPPVLLIHGNCSSSGFWEPLLRHLPAHWRIVAPDLRGYGDSPALPVDATRGVRDFADDIAPLLTSFGTKPVVVGHSLGGGVAMQLLLDHPDAIAALVLEAPVSPYGFGGTRDADGTPTTPDFAGTGGGSANPDFVRLLAAKDRGTEEQASPRNVMRAFYVASPESFGDDEELLLDTMLSTATGEDNYPGDGSTSENWPGVGPGTRGVLNTLSPRWLNLSGIVDLPVKPPITWIRGDQDAIVSDGSFFDLAQLGKLGLVPGWPGEEACPPQPMIGQTRAVLSRYGSFREVVFENCGHSPHVERATEFADILKEVVEP
ncbi:alpha/beta hydrolase [Dactylosporangium sp. AC04546]|uniref:alpha/beta hydrolase n=1 Tax=Dactylosporangium sp. AC04546 TaxID=2862460 RepID=UPI001EDE6B5B|nr:alpha/beta hydrolase [Dactylosporangium sp. AC04546]WVK85084.1 alpha/beta hydrolase [Dactylosporangium sp. AC04546]